MDFPVHQSKTELKCRLSELHWSCARSTNINSDLQVELRNISNYSVSGKSHSWIESDLQKVIKISASGFNEDSIKPVYVSVKIIMLRGVVHSLCLCFTKKTYSLFEGLSSILKICRPLESHQYAGRISLFHWGNTWFAGSWQSSFSYKP